AFLLTFGATTAILLAFGRVPVSSVPRMLRPLGEMFLASAAAEAALLPVSASVFERVTFAGLALNCAAIPLMAVAQLAGMLVVPLAAVSARLAALIGWVASIGAEGLVRSAELVRFAPALTWRVAAPSAGAIVCYYTSMLSAWWLWRRRIDPLADRRRRIAARL